MARVLNFSPLFKESYQYEIQHVFIIKPDTFWQKQKTSFASAKYSFEVAFLTEEHSLTRT